MEFAATGGSGYVVESAPRQVRFPHGFSKTYSSEMFASELLNAPPLGGVYRNEGSNMKLIVIFVAIAGLSSAQAPAAEAPPTPPAVVSQFLGLNETQQATFQRLLQTLQATVPPLAQQADARGQALDQALNATPPDPATAGRILIEIRPIQKQIQQAVGTYRQSFIAVLSDEQKQKLQAVTQASTLLPAVQVFAASMLVDAPH